MIWISKTIPLIVRQSNLKFSRRSRRSPLFRRATRHSLVSHVTRHTYQFGNKRLQIMCVYMASLTWRALKRLYALSGLRVRKVAATTSSMPPKAVSEVIFHLRDINQAMTNAWEKEFAPYSNTVKVIILKFTFFMPYRIYSINRPGRLLKFWTLRVGAY